MKCDAPIRNKKLTRKQADTMLRRLAELERQREVTYRDISDSALQKLHKQILSRVVSLVRDTQYDPELHRYVMAELDRQEVDLDKFQEWLYD